MWRYGDVEAGSIYDLSEANLIKVMMAAGSLVCCSGSMLQCRSGCAASDAMLYVSTRSVFELVSQQYKGQQWHRHEQYKGQQDRRDPAVC